MIDNQKRIKSALYVILFLVLVAWVRIGWVMFYPYGPVTIHSSRILNDKVLAGQEVIVEVCFTKHLSVSCTVNRNLIGDVVFFFPSHDSDAPVGRQTTMFSVMIPPFIQPGEYLLSTTYDYTVSRFPERHVLVNWKTEKFTVVK